MLYAIVALLAVILDQWLKLWVSSNIVLNTGSVEVIPGVVSFINLHNSGAAFGLLSNFASSKTVFIVVCIVFVVLAIALLAGNVIKGKLGRWCVVMVMAGGVGNCIDRILYGYVQDMIKVEFINFAVFNVADIFITVFCFLFIFYIIFGGGSKSSDDDDDDDDYDDDDYDDDDDFDDDEEEEPARPLFKGKSKEKASVSPAEPEVRRTPAASRKARQQEVDDKYARFKAERAAREQAENAVPKETPKPKAVPVTAEDPFAEWERKAREDRRAEEKAASKKPVSAEEAAENDPFAAWERANRRAESAVAGKSSGAVSAAVNEVPAAPAVKKPAPAPVSKPKVSESYDIEDILNEFK